MDSTGKKILFVVWHSRTGAAKQMAMAAVEGARDVIAELQAAHQLNIIIKEAHEADTPDLLQADGMLFCAPENLAALSGAMKEFFDRCYYGALDRLNGRPYALLISAGSDGSNAARQAERICTGWRLTPIAPVHIANLHAQTAEDILAPKKLSKQDYEACKTIGGTLAALLL
ncbi:flavodoxin family protein [Pollutimonas harenae]|uniref:Flavodoxin family protein n=1 Tax=Pollutimonas harenae TaxID=657015 RepID=A0A853H5Y0_9BURK|nr:NAD(P)H-dependent oxidoreductase [Pollutimonas harenae]NYT85514.1 flavodoxin family protein [Pollutimonas harenae]TEA70601.1 flavodoxin family protein [Pollutimonas harenae]